MRKSLAITGSILALAGCGSVKAITPAPSAPAPTTAPHTSFTPAPPASPATVGTSFQVKGESLSGPTATYDVTLDQVLQDAALAPYNDLANPGDHAAGAEFTIAGKAGQSQDDADVDAIVVGSDGQDYQATASELAAGTNFNYGTFNVGPGDHVSGWVSFELPHGVKIVKVQWVPSMDVIPATWNVSS